MKGVTFTVNAETEAAAAELHGFFASLQKSLQGVVPVAEEITARFKAMLPALGAAALVGAIVKVGSEMEHAVQRAIEFADAMGKASQRVGVAVENLSGLTVAARLADVSAQELGRSIVFLGKQISEADSGNEQAQQLFRDLGVSIRNVAGDLKTGDQLLGEVADRFASMPDGITKSRLAMELFERNGTALIPLLNGGSAGLRDLKAEAEEFGLVIGKRFAQNAEKFNDNLTRMKLLLEGVFLKIADAVLPDLVKLSDLILDVARSFGIHNGIAGTVIDIYKQITAEIAKAVFMLDSLLSFTATFFGALSVSGNPFEAWEAATEQFGEKLDRLKQRLEEISKLGTIDDSKPGKEGDDLVKQRRMLRAKLEDQRKELDLKYEENELIRKQIQLDQSLSPEAKQIELNRQLRIEIDLIKKKRQLTSDAFFGSNGNPKYITSDEAQRFDLKDKGQLQDLEQQKSPEDIKGNIRKSLHDMRDQWGTTAEQIGNVFKTTIESAISSISSGITDLILRTKDWGTALQQIGTSFLSEIINQIVTMGIRWVLTHSIMAAALKAFHAIAKALGWEQVATVNAQEAAKAPVLAVNATNASTSSYGAAAIIGIAAMVAAIGIGLAAALGAFEEGGYTGPGGRSQVAGVVHRGEYVFSAPAVQRIGLSNLESMHAGGGAGSDRDLSRPSTNVHFAILNDESRVPNWANTREGEMWVLDVVRRRAHEVS